MDWRNEYIKKLNEDVAEVKGGLHELRVDVKTLGEKLDTKIDNVRAEIKGDIGSLRTEVKEDIGNLRAEVKAGETSLHNELYNFRKETRLFARWAFGFMITMVIGFLGVIAAVFGH